MEIIMIDTETTGLFGYPDDVVVEIALCITEDKAKGYLRHRTGYIYPVDDPVLLDNPIPREKLQEHGIALPQSFVRLDAEVEALLMCLSKEAIA